MVIDNEGKGGYSLALVDLESGDDPLKLFSCIDSDNLLQFSVIPDR